jgi:hypothetical protein
MKQPLQRAKMTLRALPMLVLSVVLLAVSDRAHAANGAYSVDAADISDLNSCKIESWISTATNADFSAVANPSCVVNIVRPVELTLQTNYFRSGGAYGTSLSPKAKINLIPTAVGQWGVSAYGGLSFDALSGDNTAVYGVIPATFRLSEITRININAGWLWDRTIDQHYFTYGVGFDWKISDVFQYTIEMYGQLGQSDIPSVTQPKFQTGLRYRPNETFSVDVIYGHNITGENANWITVGTTVRFPPPGAERTLTGGHL